MTRLLGLTAVVVALVCCASSRPSAQGALRQATGAETDFALSLCQEPGDSLELLVGPRAQVLRRGTSARRLDGSILARLNNTPQAVVAIAGSWVFVYDAARQAATRALCGSGNATTRLFQGEVRQAVLSESGDVAVLMRNGTAMVAPGSAWNLGNPSPPVTLEARAGAPPQSVVWVDRTLWLFSANAVRIADPAKNDDEVLPVVDSHPSDVVRAFAYSGLVYVLNADGCLDLLRADPSMARLRRAACVQPAAVQGYLGLDRATIRMFRPDGGPLADMDRVSMVSARLTGGVRDIAANLVELAKAPWVPTVPMGTPSPLTRDTQDSGAVWQEIVKREWWTSAGAFEAGLNTFKSRNWSDFHDDRGWKAGTGIALRWQTGSGLVTPTGRDLAVLAKERYFQQAYSPAQVEDILRSNATLGRSLEGRLFQDKDGWMPIGALFATESGVPVAFATPQSVESLRPSRALDAGVHRSLVAQLKALSTPNSCAPAPESSAMANTLINGVSVVSRVPLPSNWPLKPGDAEQMKAESVTFVTCRGLGGAPPLRVLVARLVQIGPLEQFPAYLSGSPSVGGVTYGRSSDGNWPVAVKGDVIVAVSLGSDSVELRQRLLRGWIDGLLVRKRIDPIRLPISLLEVLIAVRANWQEEYKSLTFVSVVSAERIPGTARSLDCPPAQAAAQRRQLYEKLIDLAPAVPRNVDIPIIGVIENGVDRSSTMFTRANGQSAWVVFDETTQEFVPLTGASTASGLATGVPHGTRVASMLFSQGPPAGVLNDARLTWLDGAQPRQSVLIELAATRNIVNVSQKLSPVWLTLKDLIGGAWSPLLFVAAAHNESVNDIEDGPPLSWTHPNVIGVGLLDDTGTTPSSLLATYDWKHVDLLAPGISVPTVGDPQPICFDGTSYATAYVSAVAALLQQRADGDLLATQIRARLVATATWKDEYWQRVRGGVVSAARALDGLRENLLTLEQADGSKLELSVKLDIGQFSGTGVSPDLPGRQNLTNISWSDVLRLTRTSSPTTDATTGRRQAAYRLVVIQNRRLMTFKDVIFDDLSALPVSACKRRADGRELTCGATELATALDYVAERPRDARIVF